MLIPAPDFLAGAARRIAGAAEGPDDFECGAGDLFAIEGAVTDGTEAAAGVAFSVVLSGAPIPPPGRTAAAVALLC